MFCTLSFHSTKDPLRTYARLTDAVIPLLTNAQVRFIIQLVKDFMFVDVGFDIAIIFDMASM